MYLAGSGEPQENLSGVTFAGFGTVEASWLQADTADVAWLQWNRVMERAALKASWGQSSWAKVKADGADLEVSMQLERVTPAMVSVEVDTFSMGHGAAHPNHESEQVNWLRKEDRALRVGDVFRSGSRWRPAVARVCWNFLNQELGRDGLLIEGSDDKGLLEVVSSPANWAIDRRGLAIGFPDYSVSGHSSPAPDALLTWRWLKPYLVSGMVSSK